MIGLAPRTLNVIESVATLSSLEGYTLVGGTSISTQIDHRQSEDLDFCKWVDKSGVKTGIEFKSIEKELQANFEVVETDILGFDQVDFYVDGVKITFFNEVGFNVPFFEKIPLIGNIYNTPLQVVGTMKVKTMFERNKHRDYYDLYVLVKEGHISLNDLMNFSIEYHNKLNHKMILNRLKNWKQFEEDFGLAQLNPKYTVTSQEIGDFFNELSNN